MTTFANGDLLAEIRDKLNATGIRKNKFDATADPAAGDDAAAGYEVGSAWINVTTGARFILVNATEAAAVWLPIGSVIAADLATYLQPGDDALETVEARTVSADAQLVQDDRGRFVDATTALTVTIPTNATVGFSVGSIITVSRHGAGVVTIAAAAGVSLNGVDGGSGTIGTQWQGASLRKIGINAWVASGDIEVA